MQTCFADDNACIHTSNRCLPRNSNRRKNVLILSYEFTPIVGGAGTYSRELAVGLTRNNCDVNVVTCYHGLKEHNTRIDEELCGKYRIKVHRFDSHGKLFFIQMYKKIYKIFGRMYHNSFDYIILADARSTRFAVLFMNDEQLAKSVHVFHGGEIDSFFLKPNYRVRLSGIRRKFISVLLKSRANIAVSENLKNIFLSEIPQLKGKMGVVLHGIDEEMFHPLTEAERENIRGLYGIKKNAVVILSASRLIAEKGQDKLIQAFSPLAEKYQDLEMVIAGDGNYRDELKKITERLSLRDRIVFTGKLARDNLAKLMAASDYYAMIS